MRLVVALLFFALAALPAVADDRATKQQLAREFVDETRGGLPQSVIDAIWKPYKAQLRTYNPLITDAALDSMKAVLVDEFSKLADQLRDAYAELYARDLTEDQLRQLLAFFKSPLGQTYMDVNASVGTEMAPQLQQTMTSLLADLTQKLNDAARKQGLKLGA